MEYNKIKNKKYHKYMTADFPGLVQQQKNFNKKWR